MGILVSLLRCAPRTPEVSQLAKCHGPAWTASPQHVVRAFPFHSGCNNRGTHLKAAEQTHAASVSIFDPLLSQRAVRRLNTVGAEQVFTKYRQALGRVEVMCRHNPMACFSPGFPSKATQHLIKLNAGSSSMPSSISY